MKRTALAAAVAAAAIGLLAACTASVSNEATVAAAPSSAPAVDEAALVASLDGQAHMLWFWAPN